MDTAHIALRRELLPRQPRKFAIFAEGPLEEICRPRGVMEPLAGNLVAAEAA
jgi:hypothetical protein